MDIVEANAVFEAKSVYDAQHEAEHRYSGPLVEFISVAALEDYAKRVVSAIAGLDNVDPPAFETSQSRDYTDGDMEVRSLFNEQANVIQLGCLGPIFPSPWTVLHELAHWTDWAARHDLGHGTYFCADFVALARAGISTRAGEVLLASFAARGIEVAPNTLWPRSTRPTTWKLAS